MTLENILTICMLTALGVWSVGEITTLRSEVASLQKFQLGLQSCSRGIAVMTPSGAVTMVCQP